MSIVGDFSEEDIESCVMDYLGTVRARRGVERALIYNPILFRPSPNDLHFQQVRLFLSCDKLLTNFLYITSGLIACFLFDRCS